MNVNLFLFMILKNGEKLSNVEFIYNMIIIRICYYKKNDFINVWDVYEYILFRMEEKGYHSNKKLYKIIQYFGIILLSIGLLGFIVCLVLAMLSLNDVIQDSSKYTYISIIRQNNNTDLINLKRTLCLAAYFKYFPFNIPNIGYELVLNSTNSNSLYTLDKVSEELNTTVHIRDSYNSDKMKHDFSNNIVIAWDHNHIPELAQSLGCKQCNGWNNNPKLNIMDESLFDVTWVIRRRKYDDVILNRGITIDFYTIPQNFENSILRLWAPITDGMTTHEIVRNYECEYVLDYDIKKW